MRKDDRLPEVPILTAGMFKLYREYLSAPLYRDRLAKFRGQTHPCPLNRTNLSALCFLSNTRKIFCEISGVSTAYIEKREYVRESSPPSVPTLARIASEKILNLPQKIEVTLETLKMFIITGNDNFAQVRWTFKIPRRAFPVTILEKYGLPKKTCLKLFKTFVDANVEAVKEILELEMSHLFPPDCQKNEIDLTLLYDELLSVESEVTEYYFTCIYARLEPPASLIERGDIICHFSDCSELLTVAHAKCFSFDSAREFLINNNC